MAESSMLWDTTGTGDGLVGGYTENNWIDFLKDIFLAGLEASAGVLLSNSGSNLACTGTATPIAVAAGSAIVAGFFYKNTASVNLAVTTPVVGTTGGHVVLRASWTAQTVRLVAVRNTDGVAGIPSLTQSAGTTWEIRLCSFTITTGGVITITDARTYVKPAIKVGTSMIDDDAITLAKMANTSVGTAELVADSVDDTKAGNRVPQFYRRQGGSATDWSIAGTSTQTPTAVRIQGGVRTSTGSSIVTVTFPTAFSQPPIFVATANGPGVMIGINGVSATQAVVEMVGHAGGGSANEFNWLAFGPE